MHSSMSTGSLQSNAVGGNLNNILEQQTEASDDEEDDQNILLKCDGIMLIIIMIFWEGTKCCMRFPAYYMLYLYKNIPTKFAKDSLVQSVGNCVFSVILK